MKPSCAQETQSKNLNEFGTDATEQSSTLKIKFWIKARTVICASPVHRGLIRFESSENSRMEKLLQSYALYVAFVTTVVVTEGSNCFYISLALNIFLVERVRIGLSI